MASVTREPREKPDIVQREQARAEHLLAHEQVPNVRAVVVGAARTPTPFHNWPAIGAKSTLPNLRGAVGREGRAMAPEPCGRHTVEEVNAAANSFYNVVGMSNPHEVARQRARQHRINRLEHFIEFCRRLAHGHAADGNASPISCSENSRD